MWLPLLCLLSLAVFATWQLTEGEWVAGFIAPAAWAGSWLLWREPRSAR